MLTINSTFGTKKVLSILIQLCLVKFHSALKGRNLSTQGEALCET
jgi:hypothetical protein